MIKQGQKLRKERDICSLFYVSDRPLKREGGDRKKEKYVLLNSNNFEIQNFVIMPRHSFFCEM